MKIREKRIYRVTLIGSICNLLLLIFKFVAGILGRSSAMIADAVHSLSDFATDIIVLFFVKLSSAPRDKDHQYGHGKFETLATALIGLALLGVGFGILWSGALKIWEITHGKPFENAEPIALWAALVSIVVKELLYHYTTRIGKAVKSDVVVANAWHHRSDSLSSIATAIGIGGALLLGGKWIILDPIAACVVSLLIMKSAFSLLIPSVNELLEKSLPKSQVQQILDILNSAPGVHEPHNLRTRKIGPIKSIDVHVRMEGSVSVADSHAVTKDLEHEIRNLLGNETIINIHVEPLKKPLQKK